MSLFLNLQAPPRIPLLIENRYDRDEDRNAHSITPDDVPGPPRDYTPYTNTQAKAATKAPAKAVSKKAPTREVATKAPAKSVSKKVPAKAVSKKAPSKASHKTVPQTASKKSPADAVSATRVGKKRLGVFFVLCR